MYKKGIDHVLKAAILFFFWKNSNELAADISMIIQRYSVQKGEAIEHEGSLVVNYHLFPQTPATLEVLTACCMIFGTHFCLDRGH